VARNVELVRQWEVLRTIDARRNGVSIAELADAQNVHQRTIRRDIDALCRAGFPLFDDSSDGVPVWKLSGHPFRSLEQIGLGIAELAAIYFGHAVLAVSTSGTFENDGEQALMKLERTVPQASRRLMNGFPRVLTAKHTGRKTFGDGRKAREIAGRAIDAILRRRCATMRYASRSSGRTSLYAVEPQRLSCADGGVYLSAWVPAYREMRTFALERIETFAIDDAHFEPQPLPAEPFPNSLGVFTGPAESVAIEFDAAAAPYVRERQWHRSQSIDNRADGTIVLRMEICVDWPLRAWILGFGASARVLSPPALANDIVEHLRRAADRYRGSPKPEMARLQIVSTDQTLSNAG
jgi:predicted DNA-binding transcriptional regulator YafY